MHGSNLGYLPNRSDEAVQNALADPNAFRGNRMAQLKQATDQLRRQIDEIVKANRATVITAIEDRKTELIASAFYEKATAETQHGVVQKIDQVLSRVGEEGQVALILQIGAEFEDKVYPSLLDQLADSQQGGGDTPRKQTISIRTVTVSGAPGVLETPTDVENYLKALRATLLQILKDNRISL